MTPPTLPTGTVTLLFTDVESSTALLQSLGADYDALLAEHNRIIRDCAARFDGHVVDTQGDAFLLAFPTATGAVNAATAVQHELASRRWPQDARVRVRMGVHTGEPRRSDTGYVGIDLHRGARVCAAAHGGQVLVSGATQPLLGDVHLRDLGMHLLKDLPAPERLYQLECDGLPGTFPPPRSLNATNLPQKATPLVGRRRELEDLRALLTRDDVRVVTCTGPGGTGKTRLALQAAADVAAHFRDGVFFVGLAPVTEADRVEEVVASALGIHEVSELRAYLAERRLLLVLDNVEQIRELARIVTPLLESAPGLKLLATGRAAIHAGGEHELRVPPLGSADAARLFVERARAVDRAFAAEAGLVTEICDRVDRLPLGIELAAARVDVLSPAELRSRLSQRLELLTRGAADAPERQRTLRHTLEWSHGLLGSAEQALFAQFSVFVGGATLAAVESVCRCDLESISELVANSLLQRTGDDRFSMLETVREFALECLERRDDASEVRRRHAQYFVQLAERAEEELESDRQAECLAQLDADYANLRAALEYLREDAPAVVRATAALLRFWRARGHAADARAWLAHALDRVDDPRLRAEGLWAAGRLAMTQADFEDAAARYREALDCFRSAGDARGEAFTLAELGLIAFERGDVDEAEALCEESLRVARHSGDARAASAALTNLAYVMSEKAEHPRARELFAESLALRRDLGNPLLIANTAHQLARAALTAMEITDAREAASECLRIARELGDLLHIAGALCLLGEAAVLDRDPAAAMPSLRESLEIYLRLGNVHGMIECVNAIGAVVALDGRAEEAARLWGAAEAARRRLELVLHEIEVAIMFRAVPRALADIGESAFDAVRAEGRRLPLEAAAGQALRR